MYARTPEMVMEIYRDRQKRQDPVVARMEKARKQYNGDIVVPLPELDKDEKSSVANLMQQGLDGYAGRIAGVMPNLQCPPTNPRLKGSIAKAETRRRANLSWWQKNRIPIKLQRRARLLIGYGLSPVAMRPDFKKGIARWEPRNPLTTYPAPCLDPDDLVPDDCIYATTRTLGYIRSVWPDKANALAPVDDPPGTEFTILEYDDAEQTMMLVLNTQDNIWRHMAEFMVLEQEPNRTEIPLSVIAGRVTLDRTTGQFDGILGMYQMQAKLFALEVHAVQKGVFPNTYLVGRQNETPAFISGPHDGSTGLVNIVEGGDVTTTAPNPGFMTNQTIDRLERAQRQEAGIPSEMGGESGTNIRTGKRGDAVISAQVDFRLAEAQDMLAASLEEENYRAVKIAKAYFGDMPKSIQCNWRGAKGEVTYTPNLDFDSAYTNVSYAIPGADVQNLTVGLSQMVGTELISQDTARQKHPWVDDADLEGDKVLAQKLRNALTESLQQAAAQGSLPPADFARLVQLVEGEQNMEIEDAVIQVQKEAQERQAVSGAPGTPAAPVEPGSPEAQPGLAQPGQGAEAGVTVPQTGASLSNLDDLMMKVRGTSAAA